MRKLKGLVLVAFMAVGMMSFTVLTMSPPDNPCIGYATNALGNEIDTFGSMTDEEIVDSYNWYYNYCMGNIDGGNAVALLSLTVNP